METAIFQQRLWSTWDAPTTVVGLFELAVTRFGPPDIPNGLEHRSCWDQNRVKKSSTMPSPKRVLDPLGSCGTRFGPIWCINSIAHTRSGDTLSQQLLLEN